MSLERSHEPVVRDDVDHGILIAGKYREVCGDGTASEQSDQERHDHECVRAL
jgi:hypothetical protein